MNLCKKIPLGALVTFGALGVFSPEAVIGVYPHIIFSQTPMARAPWTEALTPAGFLLLT